MSEHSPTAAPGESQPITNSTDVNSHGVRQCRGHWHVTCCGEDLSVSGDPFKTREAALAAADALNAGRPLAAPGDAGEPAEMTPEEEAAFLEQLRPMLDEKSREFVRGEVADLLDDADRALTAHGAPTPGRDNALYYPLLFLTRALRAHPVTPAPLDPQLRAALSIADKLSDPVDAAVIRELVRRVRVMDRQQPAPREDGTPTPILINGQTHRVFPEAKAGLFDGECDSQLTYETLVRLAGLTGQPTMVVHYPAWSNQRDGSVRPGQTCKIVRDMHIECVHANGA